MIENYEKKLFVLLASGLLSRGRVYQLDVAHEANCPKLHGGPCRCEPDILLDGKKVEVPT